MSTGPESSAGILIALLSAATFATSGPVRQVAARRPGWTPGSVVFLRIAGAALLLLVPTVRALEGRWHLLRREWRQVVAYGLLAVALPQLAFFYAVAHLSVGVALLLEYLGLVLVVVWQCRAGPPAARAVHGRSGSCWRWSGWCWSSTCSVGCAIDGIGVAWGLLAALGLASYFLMSGSTHETALPPLALAGGGLVVGAIAFARARADRRAADGVRDRAWSS